MRILVTGITGFVGEHLIDSLLATQSHEIFGMYRQVSRASIPTSRPGVTLIEGDITEYQSVSSVVETSSPDLVFHLAAKTHVKYAYANPAPYVSTNLNGTVHLVEAILKFAPRAHLLFASTAQVYGIHVDEPIYEDFHMNPTNVYGWSKAAAEEYVRSIIRSRHLRATILRFMTTYGRLDSEYFVEYLISKMLKNDPIFVGNPDAVRDYMYIDDHVSAYLSVLQHLQSTLGETYNVSPGNPIMNRQLVDTLKEMTSTTSRIDVSEYPPDYGIRPITQDISYSLASDKIRKDLGWKPKFSLAAGLGATIKKWRQKTGKNDVHPQVP